MSDNVRAKRASPARNGTSMLTELASVTAAFALAHGVSLDEIQQATGLSAPNLLDSRHRVDDETLPRLWRAISEANPDVAMPLKMARAAPFGGMGGLAEAGRFARTLRDAIDFMQSYSTIVADRISFRLDESRSDELVAVAINHPCDVIDYGRSAEFSLALFLRFVRDVLEIPVEFECVELTFPPLGRDEEYREFFGTDVRFDAEVNQVLLHRSWMDRVPSSASDDLFTFARIHFDNLLQALQIQSFPEPLAGLYAAARANAANGDFAVEKIAENAGLSLRTAQRIAAEGDRSLKGIVEAVRCEEAKRLLRQRSVAIVTVAIAVGYSDERSFRRAFKRWTGMSPAAFRRSAVLR